MTALGYTAQPLRRIGTRPPVSADV